MDSQNSKINVLVVGAYGRMGSAVTRRCLEQPNLAVSILVRDPQKNKELADQVTQAGGRVIKGDVTQPDTIKGVTKGMHTVIMTFDNIDDKVAVGGQITVIKDCIENGVERVVPAEYSTDPTKFSAEELQSNSVVGNKIKIQEYLKTVPIKHLNINTGIILDWFLDAVIPGGFDYWGDKNTKLQLTTYDDTAKVLAAAVAQKDKTGDVVFVSDDVTTIELAEIYNRVRGTDQKARHLGTLPEMHAKVAELEKEGKHEEAFLLSLTVFIYDERTRFDKTHNDEFKNVKTTSIEEFFRQNPNVVIGA